MLLNPYRYVKEGRYFAVGMQNADQLQIYDAYTLTKMNISGYQPTYRGFVKFSPDEKKLAINNLGSGVVVYQAPTWFRINIEPAISIDGTDCDWSPDGSILAVSARFGSRLLLYNTNTWEKIPLPPTLPDNHMNGVAFSPDGTKVVFVGDGGKVFIYNTLTWEIINTQTISSSSSLYKVAWTPDGSKIIIACGWGSSGTIKIINANTWTITIPPNQPIGPVNDVKISPNGKYAAFAWSNSVDKFLVYNLPSWTRVPTPISPPTDNEAGGVAFSHDGDLLSITQKSNTGAPGVLTYKISDWSLLPALVPHLQDNCYGIDYS